MRVAFPDMETLATVTVLMNTASDVNTEYAIETSNCDALRILTSQSTSDNHFQPLLSTSVRADAISHDIRHFRVALWILDECVAFNPACGF